MTISEQIKETAYSLGFDACGICRTESIQQTEREHLQKWLCKGYQAEMSYLNNNFEKRIDPRLLVEDARSVICLAINYYPQEKLPDHVPQFAYYAYGQDYHDVVKAKLTKLLDAIRLICPQAEGRYFVDTAPVLERYWAAKSGIGFIGKNTLLIIPGKGSYFFLGEIMVNLELDYDEPLTVSCGNCRRCIDACPTKAIESPYLLNSKSCISYQTIENKGEIAPEVYPLLKNNIYGCDICQRVCPWNRFSSAHRTEEFRPSSEFLSLDLDALDRMTETDYRRIFKGSAVKRVKYIGLKRNLDALKS